MLSASDAARILDVDISLIQRLCRTGRLGYTHKRIGKVWIITREEIDKYKANPMKRGPKPKPKAE